MTQLILVRHGQASFGGSNYDVLSPTGGRQSEVLGRHWHKLQFNAEHLYSGEMSRQKDTATKALAQAGISAQPKVLPAFNEYDFENIVRGYLPLIAREHPEIKLDGRTVFSDPKQFQMVFEVLIGYWLEARQPEGRPVESWKSFRERVVAGFKEIATEDRERVVVFTSGGVITVALQEALQLSAPLAFRMNWRIANASQHVFRVGKRGLSLLSFNNTSHLELERDPALMTFR